jgi:hypothetical protein
MVASNILTNDWLGYDRHRARAIRIGPSETKNGGTMHKMRKEPRPFDEVQWVPSKWLGCWNSIVLTLLTGPIIRFMLENIRQANGKLDKTNIRCLPCGKIQSGGFDANYGILLCQNRLIDRSHMEDTLAHELVHAYDHLRFDVDWKDIKHHACSEVSSPHKHSSSPLR